MNHDSHVVVQILSLGVVPEVKVEPQLSQSSPCVRVPLSWFGPCAWRVVLRSRLRGPTVKSEHCSSRLPDSEIVVATPDWWKVTCEMGPAAIHSLKVLCLKSGQWVWTGAATSGEEDGAWNAGRCGRGCASRVTPGSLLVLCACCPCAVTVQGAESHSSFIDD